MITVPIFFSYTTQHTHLQMRRAYGWRKIFFLCFLTMWGRVSACHAAQASCVDISPITSTDARRVLGVEANATPKQIKKAFRSLALRFHPDRNTGKSKQELKDMENRMKNINEAFTILSKLSSSSKPGVNSTEKNSKTYFGFPFFKFTKEEDLEDFLETFFEWFDKNIDFLDPEPNPSDTGKNSSNVDSNLSKSSVPTDNPSNLSETFVVEDDPINLSETFVVEDDPINLSETLIIEDDPINLSETLVVEDDPYGLATNLSGAFDLGDNPFSADISF